VVEVKARVQKRDAIQNGRSEIDSGFRSSDAGDSTSSTRFSIPVLC
jgi:hypothetical protein